MLFLPIRSETKATTNNNNHNYNKLQHKQQQEHQGREKMMTTRLLQSLRHLRQQRATTLHTAFTFYSLLFLLCSTSYVPCNCNKAIQSLVQAVIVIIATSLLPHHHLSFDERKSIPLIIADSSSRFCSSEHTVREAHIHRHHILPAAATHSHPSLHSFDDKREKRVSSFSCSSHESGVI